MKAAVKCKLLLYADDSALLASSSDVSEIEDVLSRELESVSEWLAGVVFPAGPVARGHPNGRRASQSHILTGPVGQP